MIEKVRSKNGEFLSETKTQFIWDGSHSTGVYAGQTHYHIFVVNQNPNNCQCFWNIGPKKIWGISIWVCSILLGLILTVANDLQIIRTNHTNKGE